MDFDLSNKEKALCEKIGGLFHDRPRPVDGLAGIKDLARLREETLKCFRLLGDAGYLHIPVKGEGAGPGLVAARETLAALSSSLYLAAEASTRVFGRLVAVYGTGEQRSELLAPLVEGRIIGAVGLSEETMNVENDPLTTTGLPEGRGIAVSGAKGHVVNAPIADWIAVAGTMEGKDAFFLVKNGDQGLLTGERLSTPGYEGAAISPLLLDNCTVDPGWIIEAPKVDALFRTVRMWEDQVLAAAALGLMKRSFDEAVSFAKTHRTGGKPIIAYQEVGFKLAEMLTLMETARLLAHRASWMDETGDREARVLAHCAKVFCSESAEEVSSAALQILGQSGFLKGNAAEEGYREAKYLQIAGTSTEISRMKIGDEVLQYES